MSERITYRGDKIRPEFTSEVDLWGGTYDLLTKIRKPSDAEKKALEKIIKGIVFLPLASKTLPQAIEEDRAYFWTGNLDYSKSREESIRYLLPQIEVALNPAQLALPDSFYKSLSAQLKMIDKYSKEQIERELPDAKAIMLPAVGYAQADKVYRNKTGEVLFRDLFARALDYTSKARAAFVGRYRPENQLSVRGWVADRGGIRVMAVPAIVFI